jgi:hypothetical protein
MIEFRKYRRKSISEMTPYTPTLDMSRVSVSKADGENGSPKIGDMIARNPKNHEDQWLVAKAYFEDNLEEMPPVETFMDRLIIERDELADKYVKLQVALDLKKVPEEAEEILNKQLAAMAMYLEILNERLKV